MERLKCITCGADNSINLKYCTNCGYELPQKKIENTNEELKASIPVTPSPTRRKILSIIGFVVAFALSYFAAQQIFFASPSVEKMLTQVANNINKNCPLVIDQYTRLDNTIVLPNKTFQYNYTLIDLDKSQINLDTLKGYLEPNIINLLKTSPDMKTFRDNKIIVNYHYRDKDGVFVWKLSVTPDRYQ